MRLKLMLMALAQHDLLQEEAAPFCELFRLVAQAYHSAKGLATDQCSVVSIQLQEAKFVGRERDYLSCMLVV